MNFGIITFAGEGPRTWGGGARFLGLARGSSSWGAGPACLARFLKAAAKLRLFCCAPGGPVAPGLWPWGNTPELGLWLLLIEVGWALVLTGWRPETHATMEQTITHFSHVTTSGARLLSFSFKRTIDYAKTRFTRVPKKFTRVVKNINRAM